MPEIYIKRSILCSALRVKFNFRQALHTSYSQDLILVCLHYIRLQPFLLLPEAFPEIRAESCFYSHWGGK